MFDIVTILAIFVAFLLAGTIKGIIGLGLPTVSLTLLTVTIGLPDAMALILVPSFITNLWQAMIGGNGFFILRRIWPFLLMASITVWFGAGALSRVDLQILSGLLGGLIAAYSIISIIGLKFGISKQQETWVGPAAGTINGILTGMTGSFVVPGVFYLNMIGLSRDQLIQAMGMLFTLSTLALGISLQANSLLTFELGQMSAMALFPAIIGMVVGQRIRHNLSEKLFRQVFFISLLILGCYIIARAIYKFI